MNAIDWSKIVGNKTVNDGGYAGDLLTLSLAHLQLVRDENQLTESQVGEIYASAVSTSIREAINFELQLPQVTSQVEATEVKSEQLVLDGQKNRELTEVEIDYKLKQEELVDSNIIGSGYDNERKLEEATMSTFERTFLQPKELEKLETDLDIMERRIAETESTGIKERVILDIEASIKEQQDIKITEENGGYKVIYTYYVNGVDGVETTTTNFQDVVGPILATERQAGFGISTTSLSKKLLADQDKEVVASTAREDEKLKLSKVSGMLK